MVGCGRSGTTLLRAMLDSHPELAIPGESYFVISLNRFANHPTGGFDRDGFLEAVIEHKRFKRWGVPEDAVRDAFAAGLPATYADAVRLVFSTYAHQQGKPRYGDKTPQYVLDLEELSAMFPEARFVHIIRDGRDVGLSLVEMPDWGPENLRDAARYWRGRVDEGRRAGRRLGSRYLEVRYEDLVVDPEPVLRRICGLVDLDYVDDMLRYHERAETVLAPDTLQETHQNIKRPPTERIRDWRTEMAPEQVEAFERLAGPALVRHGYTLETRNPFRVRGEEAMRATAGRIKRLGRPPRRPTFAGSRGE